MKTKLAVIFSLALTGYAVAQNDQSQEQDKPGVVSQTGAAAGQAAGVTAGTAVAGPLGGAVAGVVGGAVGGTVGKVVEGGAKKKTCDAKSDADTRCDKQQGQNDDQQAANAASSPQAEDR
jgi:hypothetical protein